MNIPIFLIILISFSTAFINAEEEANEESRDAEDEYSTIELASPRNSDVIIEEEKISPPDRSDGFAEIDDIIRSSEFNSMFNPETTQVRRFAAPMKDFESDELSKTAQLNLKSKQESKSEIEDGKTSKEINRKNKKVEKSDQKEEKSEINVDNDRKDMKKSGKEEYKSGSEDNRGKNADKNGKDTDTNGNDTNKKVKHTDENGKEEYKSVHEYDNSEKITNQKAKEDYKSETEKSKSENEMVKSGEKKDKSGKEKEKSSAEVNKTAQAIEEDKKASLEIHNIKAFRKGELPHEKSDINSERASFVGDLPTDMDDLISPFILNKFKKSYIYDESGDRSQYSETQADRYDDDVIFYDSDNSNVRPNRKMFNSYPIPAFNNKAKKEKIEMPNPNFNTFNPSPKPYIGNGFPQNVNTFSPRMFPTAMKPPYPYINNFNPLYQNRRAPLQNPRLKNIQPFARQNVNRWNQPQDSSKESTEINRSNKNRDMNEYGFATPIPLLMRTEPQVNPVFRKLAQASNYPRQMPVLTDIKFQLRPGINVPYNIHPNLSIRANYNPYLLRYKRSDILLDDKILLAGIQ